MRLFISPLPWASRHSLQNDIRGAVLLAAVVTSTILAGTQVSKAYPHVFVETFDQIVGNGHGHLSAIRTAWKFDALFFSSLLFDFDRNGNGDLNPEELSKFGATILGSAKDYKFSPISKRTAALSLSLRPVGCWRVSRRGVLCFSCR